MEAYLMTRLYHHAVTRWYSVHRDRDDKVPIHEFSTALASVFVSIFKHYSIQSILLVASDGKITSVNTMTDPAPLLFKTRRYMKIDNKSSISSISNVIAFLYQLLSIDIEERSISLLDLSGLLQFTIHLLMENECDTTEWTRVIKRHVFGVPPFALNDEVEWKEMRDRMLNQLVDPSETERLNHHDLLLEKVNACHRMIQTLLNTISLQDERISWLEHERNGTLQLSEP
jgi:hypothetical protein